MPEDTSTPQAPDPAAAELAHRCLDMARQGLTERLAAHVDAGIPVDLADDSGNTLLMLAAYHGHDATVRALLDRGSDPNRVNDRGQTPLAGAVFKGSGDVVRLLLEQGADVTVGRPSAVETARLFGQEQLLEP